MRLSASLAGLLLVGVVFVGSHASASAKEDTGIDFIQDTLVTEMNDPLRQTVIKNVEKTPPPPAPQEHVVTNDDTLSKIAETYATTWQRLYAKNPSIENPDIITVGTKVIIPLSGEVLADRPLPVAAAPVPVSAVGVTRTPTPTKARPTASSTASRGSTAGNKYVYGYCTFYAKQRRPDMPNNLGNANTWVSRAAAQGMATGSTPRVGAIGQQGMHVVYVEAVNGDGTIRVSEMNYAGFGVVSSRNVSAGSFQYIY